MKTKSTTIPKILVLATVMSIGLISLGTIDVQADVLPPTSGDYTVLAPLPCIEGGGITCTTGGNGAVQPTVNFKTYVQYTINLLIGLSAVVAVVMIVWGGAEYMYTASFSGKKMGLEKVTHAVYGLLFVLASYIILRTIDPRLVEIPNTIVPDIKINDGLSKDAISMFTDRVNQEYNKYLAENVSQNIEVAKRVDAIRDQKIQVSTEISQIDTQISELRQMNPVDTKKIAELELERKQLQSKNNDLEVKKQIETAKIYFNGVHTKALMESSDSSANGLMTVQEKLAKIEEAKQLVAKNRQEFENRLLALSYPDKAPINNLAKLTEAKIDLLKVEVIMNDAKPVVTSGMFGKQGVKHVLMVDTSGKEKNLSPEDAKKLVLDAIAKVSNTKNTITDKALRDQLQSRIDSLKSTLETHPTFN